MATVIAAPPAFSGQLSLYHTTDPLLANSPVLVFYGPAVTIAKTSSRIQVHVFTPAGLGSYARLSISPNSPFYTAVSNLPREEQGDEVCRGLAFGLKKYFAELSEQVKKTWCTQAKAPAASALFGDNHVAVLATRMTRMENVEEVISDLSREFGEQRLPWLDVDVVLPPGAIQDQTETSDDRKDEAIGVDTLSERFGRYVEIITALGDETFLPTSKLKRAPSKPTNIGRSTSFLKSQKENVRKELLELVDTEESYVGRLTELQQISKELVDDTLDEPGEHISSIFSPAIDEIVHRNSMLLEDLRKLIKRSESDDRPDSDDSRHDSQNTSRSIEDEVPDIPDLSHVASCFCKSFPQFSDCYKKYLSAHANSSKTLRTLLRSNDPMAQKLQALGEQRLTSMLIEPVQRLPRYNLYIDSIAKQLPLKHQALKPLFKARDIITDICAEDQATGSGKITHRLRSRIAGWPVETSELGRLVAAVDFVDCSHGMNMPEGTGILLLFAESIVQLARSENSSTSARALWTEIESGSLIPRAMEKLVDHPNDVQFIRQFGLNDVQCTEGVESKTLHLMVFEQSSHEQSTTDTPVHSYQVLRLEGSLEGKTTRFIEDLTKARIESRFSELERESSKWEIRATQSHAEMMSILSAVFEDSNSESVAARKSPAKTRIVVDIDRHGIRPRAGSYGVRTVIALSPNRDGLWRLSIESVDGVFNSEQLAVDEIVPALRRKLGTLASVALAIERPAMTVCMLNKNLESLKSIELHAAQESLSDISLQLSTRDPVPRARSPKKILSNFLSSVSPSSDMSGLARRELSLPSGHSSQIPRMAPSLAHSPAVSDVQQASVERSTLDTSTKPTTASNELQKKLEDTFSAYILALLARKGNIVGKTLKMRTNADELAVNELYNGLLEDPNMMVLAAQASVDVLFAAFEKFVNQAWREQFGPIISLSLLQEIQAKAETSFAIDFDNYFRSTLTSLVPQNQKALKIMMKLLADLLDGTGNDGDRGTLTAAFTEVLVTDDNPHDYIALVDRFVDDTDTYFGQPAEDTRRHRTDSVNSHKRARSVNSASLTSNTSSLRRKFGFGSSSRENSKTENESKVSSVWRTLSKSRTDLSSGHNSLSKASLARSYSTDVDNRQASSRPSSQDGSKLSFADSSFLSTGSGSHTSALSTIGEYPSHIPAGPPRKKRRSSLSDLQPLETSPRREFLASPSRARAPISPVVMEDEHLAASPSSSPLPSNGVNRYTISVLPSPRPRLPESFRKENAPHGIRALDRPAAPRPKTSEGRKGENATKTRPTSSIPSLTQAPSLSPSKTSNPRTGLAERPGAGNIIRTPSPQPEKNKQAVTPGTNKTRSSMLPSKSTPASTHTRAQSTSGSPRKLRMQSPQKLRERLQNEKNTAAVAHVDFQNELDKMSENSTGHVKQLSALPSTTVTSVTTTREGPLCIHKIAATRDLPPKSTAREGFDLSDRISELESKLSAQAEEHDRRITAIQSDLASSLSVSERKCKSLDELYREANSENEALYARFNDELGRILKQVKAGEGVEELKKRLKESQEEIGKLKRETSRLKRENVGLRAQLRE